MSTVYSNPNPAYSPPILSDLTKTSARVKAKDESIETLRGIAILLVVVGHVAIEMLRLGLLGRDALLIHFTESLSSIRMPLFTVISGYVYALRPVRSGSEGKFIRGKLRRLVLPLVSVGLITAFYFDYRADGILLNEISGRLFEIFVLHAGHVWYLKALLWIILLIMVLDSSGAIDRMVPWGVVLGLTALASMAIAGDHRDLIAFMAMGNAIYIAPFFVLGLGLRRFQRELQQRWLVWLALGVLVVGFAYQQVTMTWPVQVEPASLNAATWSPWTYADKLFIVALGFAGTLLLFLFRRPLPGMAFLGRYAYPIFLFHTISYYAGYLVCTKGLGIDQPVGVFVLMLIGGLFLPIAVYFVATQNRWTRRLLLGAR
ncbi:MAG: acyltransferase [Planctomycetota bacterium]